MTKPIEDLPGEEWLEVADSEGKYYVSNMGRIKSFKRRAPAIIKPMPNGFNYWQVGLRIGGKRRSFLVHRLVMLTFSPIENPDEWEVNHRDFDTANCALSNLEWATPLHNTQHFHRSGRPRDLSKTTGSRSHLAKLTDADVVHIRERCALKERGTQIALAKHYGVDRDTIRAIVIGKTWKHLLPANQNTGEPT